MPYGCWLAGICYLCTAASAHAQHVMLCKIMMVMIHDGFVDNEYGLTKAKEK